LVLLHLQFKVRFFQTVKDPNIFYAKIWVSQFDSVLASWMLQIKLITFTINFALQVWWCYWNVYLSNLMKKNLELIQIGPAASKRSQWTINLSLKLYLTFMCCTCSIYTLQLKNHFDKLILKLVINDINFLSRCLSETMSMQLLRMARFRLKRNKSNKRFVLLQ
jgi:hypothetical protein